MDDSTNTSSFHQRGSLNFNSQYLQSGMSLVEVMLALALGLFLIFGFIQIYLSVQKTFHLQQAIISIQESGRFAVHFLDESIRMAGYTHCDPASDFVNTKLAIHGYHKQLPPFLQGKTVKADTDVVMVGECVMHDGKNQFEQFAFFIGPTERKNKLGKRVYALYQKPIAGNKRELVLYVEEMRIRYGVVDSKADKNIANYVSAEEVKDWKAVRAVQIALLITSEGPVLLKPERYVFAGKELSPDRFLHREWHTYIACRELDL